MLYQHQVDALAFALAHRSLELRWDHLRREGRWSCIRREVRRWERYEFAHYGIGPAYKSMILQMLHEKYSRASDFLWTMEASTGDMVVDAVFPWALPIQGCGNG